MFTDILVMDGLRGILLVSVCMIVACFVTAHAYEATHDDVRLDRGNGHGRDATLPQLVSGYLKREVTKHFNYIKEMVVGIIKSRQKRGWITGDFGNRATPTTTSTTTTPPPPPYTGTTESTTQSTVTSSISSTSSSTSSSTTSTTQSSTSTDTTETTTVTSAAAKTRLCSRSLVGTFVAICISMFAHLFV